MTNEKTSKAQCKGQTRSGPPCRMKPTADGYCFNHSPKQAAARAQSRRAGGLARHTPHFADASTLPADVTTLEDARKILTYTLGEILGHDNSIARARVLLALFDSFVKSIEIGEIEQRLAALEAMNRQ